MSGLRNRILIGLGLGILVMLALSFWSDISQLRSILNAFRWEWFAVALLLTQFNYVLRGWKWHYYIRLVGARRIGVRDSFRLFVAGFPLAITPGKAGEALKAFWLSEWTEVPFARGLPVVLAERLSDGIAVLLLSIVGVFILPSLWPAFAVIAGMAIAIVVIMQFRSLAAGILDRLEKVTFLRNVIRPLREFYESGYLLLRPAPLLFAVGLGVISWLGEGIGFFCILIGLGIAPSLSVVIHAVFVLGFATLVGSASGLPGGLGAAEASITGLLLLTVTENPALASAATILIRLATLWFGVAQGLAVWLLTPSLWRRGAANPADGDANVAN